RRDGEGVGPAGAARENSGAWARLGRHPVVRPDRANLLDCLFHALELSLGAGVLELRPPLGPGRDDKQLAWRASGQLLPELIGNEWHYRMQQSKRGIEAV